MYNKINWHSHWIAFTNGKNKIRIRCYWLFHRSQNRFGSLNWAMKLRARRARARGERTHLDSIFETQPWLTRNCLDISHGRTPLCANSTILCRTTSGNGRPLTKTPPNWFTPPWPAMRKINKLHYNWNAQQKKWNENLSPEHNLTILLKTNCLANDCIDCELSGNWYIFFEMNNVQIAEISSSIGEIEPKIKTEFAHLQ